MKKKIRFYKALLIEIIETLCTICLYLVRNWRSKGHLAPWMRPTKFPEIPVSLERNTEVFGHPLL